MLAVYVYFGVLLLVPLWFVSYCLTRFKLHYRDGRQHSIQVSPRLHLAKRLCALFLACTSLFNAIDGLPSDSDSGQIAIRSVFFFSYCVAWLCSFALLRFELLRGLGIAWGGHRAFWPVSFAAFLGCAVFQAVIYWMNPQEEYLVWPRIAVYIVSCLLALFLTFCGLFKPNDFIPGTWKEPFMHPLALSCESLSDNLPTVKIQMENFKKKRQGEKSVVYYELIVTVKDMKFVLWKNFHDFDALQTDLRSKFASEEQVIKLPRLPDFTLSDDIDSKMQRLKHFLDEINYPAFYCEEFLDFLRMSGDLREALLKEHYNVTGSGAALGRTISYTSSIPLPEMTHVRRTHISKASNTFFDVSILDWHQSETQDGHIEYELSWALCNAGESGTREGRVFRRFNEFYLLHKGLKQDLAPAKMPEFPSKKYLSKLIRGVDKEAVEYRKRALELYMRNVMNDPAYLAQRLLDFIELKRVTPSELFHAHRSQPCDLKLHIPLDWEGEISESDEHFILYLLRFERASHTWVTKRRFREFDTLHCQLLNRIGSPMIAEFLRTVSSRGESETSLHAEDLPAFPKKTLPLSTPTEIDIRRRALESYMQSLLQSPYAMEAFAFRQFIDEPGL